MSALSLLAHLILLIPAILHVFFCSCLSAAFHSCTRGQKRGTVRLHG